VAGTGHLADQPPERAETQLAVVQLVMLVGWSNEYMQAGTLRAVETAAGHDHFEAAEQDLSPHLLHAPRVLNLRLEKGDRSEFDEIRID
jgi:hypothetical protein